MIPKHQKFVEEYVKDFNGQRAARAVGYKTSAKSRASELLARPEIKEAVDKIRSENSEKASEERNEIIEALKRIAFTPISKFCTWDRSGARMIPSRKIPKELKALVRTVEASEYGPKLKLESRLKAIELLGRHYGIFVDKMEQKHTGKIEVEITDYRSKK